MPIEYETTFEDLFAFGICNHRTSPTIQRPIRIGRIAYPLIFLASLVLFFVYFSRSLNIPALIALSTFGLVIGVAFYIVYPRLVEMRVRSITKKLYEEGRNAGLMEKRHLTINPATITHHSRLSEGTLSWEAVEKIGQTPDHLFLYTSALSALVIPRRAFASDQDWSTYINEIHTYFTASRNNGRQSSIS